MYQLERTSMIIAVPLFSLCNDECTSATMKCTSATMNDWLPKGLILLLGVMRFLIG